MRSPRVDAMLDAIFAHAARNDEYWDDLSVLAKEAAGSSIVRPFVVARCRRSLACADAATIVRVIDVLLEVKEPVARLAVPFARHAEEAVRCTVACALEDSRDPGAIAALASLCCDSQPSVRRAAITAMVRGLGVPGEHDFVDTPVVRDALAACLDDESEPSRDQVILGLAMRRDRRALAPLAALLAGDELTANLVDAAYYLAAPELRDALVRHALAGSSVSGEWSLEDAVAACTVDLR